MRFGSASDIAQAVGAFEDLWVSVSAAAACGRWWCHRPRVEPVAPLPSAGLRSGAQGQDLAPNAFFFYIEQIAGIVH